jgi:putative FmdB family regulatory protein
MPIYAFTCARCGSFELMRPVEEAAAPVACATCGEDARRVFTPPGLARVARPMRRALDLEERSAHEPGVVTEKQGRPLPHRHPATPPWVLTH